MSYDLLSGRPDDLKIEIVTSELVVVRFTCPRCGSIVKEYMCPVSFVNGFEIQCRDPKCWRQGAERFGFQLTMDPSWSECLLGLADRPLHREQEK